VQVRAPGEGTTTASRAVARAGPNAGIEPQVVPPCSSVLLHLRDPVDRERAWSLVGADSPGVLVHGLSDRAAAISMIDSGTIDVVVCDATGAQLAELCAHCRVRATEVIVLYRQVTPVDVLAVLRHGVAAIVHADTFDMLGTTVAAVRAGCAQIPLSTMRYCYELWLAHRQDEERLIAGYLALTAREREVMDLLARGQDATSISRSLFVSPNTTRTHVQRALAKLGVHSRRDAIELMRRCRITERFAPP
jgi:DNA-binding NarL/FixJ family response regulator